MSGLETFVVNKQGMFEGKIGGHSCGAADLVLGTWALGDQLAV